jgi:hypothetical protein
MNPRYSAAEIAQLYIDRDTEDLIGVYRRIAAAELVQPEYHARLDLTRPARRPRSTSC